MSRREAADPLYDDPRLASFYDLENGTAADGGRADFAFCLSLAEGAASVLDLGCGTGELAAMLAPGRHATGIDPAAAMLDVARMRPGGDQVEWIEADARRLQLEARFDLILLTGHAFQVFLTDADIAAVLSTIARHLAPDGRFVFDSRNPARREWEEWTRERSLRLADHPALGRCEAWNEIAYDDIRSIATYRTCYRPVDGGPLLSAHSDIRFTDRSALAEMIATAGLTVDRWLGNWQGDACEDSSAEIIPIGRLA